MAVSNMSLMHVLLSHLRETSLGVLRRRPDQNHNITENSNFGDIIRGSKVKCARASQGRTPNTVLGGGVPFLWPIYKPFVLFI